MEDLILISNLNDFIFCPVSIYFHKLYGNQDNLTYQSQYQINGTKAHEKVDNKKYSTRKSVKMALDVYSDEYKIVGKIDLYDEISKTLIERKKFVKKIYDGYIFQLYAQYYAMTEMGYEINHLEVRSLDESLNIITLSSCENDFSYLFFKSLTILSTILSLLSISNTEY
jgi:CRISPR-associated exonuclease Cas4